jgi:hypothetical protein
MTASTRRLRRWGGFSAIALVMATAALTLVACGDDGPEPAVGPIDGALAGDILAEDITSDGANVRVVTTIPVVCAVAFGTDDRRHS